MRERHAKTRPGAGPAHENRSRAQRGAEPVRRRRRGSSFFEGPRGAQRFTRHSLPCVSVYDTAGTLRNPALGNARADSTGERSRRMSKLSFDVAGSSGHFVPVSTGDQDGEEELEVEYLFPVWWFVLLALPDLLATYAAAWGVM